MSDVFEFPASLGIEHPGIDGAREGSAAGRVDRQVLAVAGLLPDATAIEAPDGVLTYAQLASRSGGLADRLSDLGVGDGALVGLCCRPGAALVVGALAILRCGAAYVALDPDAPVERLAFMIGDSGAAVVVVDAPAAERLAGTAVGLVVVDGSETTVPGPAMPCSDRGRAPEPGLAYVVYTSGSTGLPKGVLVEHRGLVQLARWHCRAFAVTAADRMTQIANPAFDAAAWEIWPQLMSGACVVIPDEPVRHDVVALQRFLVDHRIDIAFVPTALAELLLHRPWPAHAALRFLLTGGDALRTAPPPGLPFTLVNNYGLSEATVVSTSAVVPAGRSGGPPTIGSAIDGVELSIVDTALEPVPLGRSGELIVAGPTVARGYLRRPELDAATFIPDPSRPGARRLRTGDRVRAREDGELEFLGRVDDQVQLRGFRIEPGEIVAALDSHPAIVSSHVLVDGEQHAMRRLDAYLVPAGHDQPSDDELRSHLARTLPDYMIPSTFTWLPELPVTANGKVDRVALAASRPVPAPAAKGATWQADLAASVGSMVAQLLELDDVDADDDFFLLGGHSLLGAQLVGEVFDRFGVELRLRDVFDHPTVTGMSDRIADLLVADVDPVRGADGAGGQLSTAPSEPR